MHSRALVTLGIRRVLHAVIFRSIVGFQISPRLCVALLEEARDVHVFQYLATGSHLESTRIHCL